ncbi:MAG: TetR/AcrR family transcriptional regulator [Lachnospiraceae bacterium]|nr:TetR/AcrR family transcriptional regulator [Lachnospiraceae bacterium]
MLTYDEAKQKIIRGGLEVFQEKGAKFTMDDLAKKIGMSKKTIYVIFRDKEAVLVHMVDYIFNAIQEEEEQYLEDSSLTTIDKFRRVLGAMPENYLNYDFTKVYMMKDRFPKAYARMNERLEDGWEITFNTLQKGIDEGVFRPVNFTVFKLIYSAAVERFLNSPELDQSHVGYMDALNQLVDMLIDGIAVK